MKHRKPVTPLYSSSEKQGASNVHSVNRQKNGTQWIDEEIVGLYQGGHLTALVLQPIPVLQGAVLVTEISRFGNQLYKGRVSGVIKTYSPGFITTPTHNYPYLHTTT